MGKVIPFQALNSFYEHYFSQDELLPLLENALFEIEPVDAPILMVTHFVIAILKMLKRQQNYISHIQDWWIFFRYLQKGAAKFIRCPKEGVGGVQLGMHGIGYHYRSFTLN